MFGLRHRDFAAEAPCQVSQLDIPEVCVGRFDAFRWIGHVNLSAGGSHIGIALTIAVVPRASVPRILEAYRPAWGTPRRTQSALPDCAERIAKLLDVLL